MKSLYAGLLTAFALIPLSAQAGTDVTYEAGVVVHRAQSTTPNLRAAAEFRALALQEQQIKADARLRGQAIRNENAQAQDRIALDRRIALTPNQIFTTRSGRRGFTRNGRFFEFNSLSGFGGSQQGSTHGQIRGQAQSPRGFSARISSR